jgi:hypothetical protein
MRMPHLGALEVSIAVIVVVCVVGALFALFAALRK